MQNILTILFVTIRMLEECGLHISPSFSHLISLFIINLKWKYSSSFRGLERPRFHIPE